MKLAHAAERAAERMNVALSWADLSAMCAKIKDGKAHRLRDRKHGGEQWIVTHAGRAFRVVYSREHDSIVTVLDPLRQPRGQHRKSKRDRSHSD